MALYTSPIETALFNAFGMFGGPPLLNASRRRSILHPQPGFTIAQPSSSVKYIDGISFLEVELPGVAQENVKLDVRDGTLTISGERTVRPFGATGKEKGDEVDTSDATGPGSELKQNSAEAGSGTTNVSDDGRNPESLAHGIKYMAEFTLPPMADVENAAAEYRDGLLLVRVPRKEPTQLRETQNIKIAM